LEVLACKRPAPATPKGCPLLNTAIDSDHGNPQLREKARRALRSWLSRLESTIKEGQRRREIQGDIDSAELATLIVSALEGGLMVSCLQRKDNPRNWASRHLQEHLETNVRAKEFKGRTTKP
jgi:TetR/AcrR family transcriptional repressor of nem operon